MNKVNIEKRKKLSVEGRRRKIYRCPPFESLLNVLKFEGYCVYIVCHYVSKGEGFSDLVTFGHAAVGFIPNLLKLHFSNFVSLGDGFFNADAERPTFFGRIDGSGQTIAPVFWKN